MAPRSAAPGAERLLALAGWALLFAFGAALGLQVIRSLDYWWLLRTGELILETGAIPRYDPYTYTVPGARWIDIHWLFQVGLYGLYRLGGHGAVVLATAGLVCALLALLAPIGYRRERPAVTWVALALLLVIACERFMPRPDLLSLVLLAAVLALLDRFERTGDAWVYAILPVQIFWVNVHGLFALGVAVCAAHLVGELLRPLGAAGTGLRRDRTRRLAAVTAGAALASLVNPNLLDGALYPLQQLHMVGSAEARGFFGRAIGELQPTFSSMAPLPLALFVLLALLSLAAMSLNWNRVRESDPLLWVAFFYLALGARRNAAVFAVVAVPILVRNANELLDSRPLPARLGRRVTLGVALCLALLVVDVARDRFYPRLGNPRTLGLGADPDFNPVGAVDWIDEHRPPGPIAHHMTDGGYLIWRLHPDYPVMTDGRLEVFGPETFESLMMTDPERFQELDRRFRFGTVLAHYSNLDLNALLAWWYRQPEWHLAYVDDVAAVFVRSGEDGSVPAPELDLDAPDLFPPLPASPDARELPRLRARTRFLIALGRYDLAIATWEQALARHPDAPEGAQVLEALRQQAGAASRR